MTVALRWDGNGVADGTEVLSGNVAAAGNGDTTGVAVAKGGAPVMVYAGNGFAVRGGTGDIGRLDFTLTASGALVAQVDFTSGGAPTSTNENIIVFRNATTGVAAVRHTTAGRLEIDASNVVPTGSVSLSPALVTGHKYRIDALATLHSSPTTSNGRFVYRVRSLTDPTGWNAGQPFFYDSGYTVNLGTAQLTTIRVGKTGVGAYAADQVFEDIGRGATTVPTTDTSQTAIEAHLLDPPAVPVRPQAVAGTVVGTWNTFGGAATRGGALADENTATGIQSGTLTGTTQSVTLPFDALPPAGPAMLEVELDKTVTSAALVTVRVLQGTVTRKEWQVRPTLTRTTYHLGLTDTEVGAIRTANTPISLYIAAVTG